MTRYIIEPHGKDWRAVVEDRPDLGEGIGTAPLYALRDLNLSIYWGRVQADEKAKKVRKAAFKALKRHFRATQGIPMWWPRAWFSKAEKLAADRHHAMVVRIAREMDEKGGGEWSDVVEAVNAEWKG